MGFEDLGHIWMHTQQNILALDRLRYLLCFYQDLPDDCLDTLNVPRTFAVRARRAEGSFQTLLHTLARDRHESEIIELENLVGSFIGAHGFFERLHHLLPVLALVHIDEVHDDDAAQVAQPDLPHDFLNRFNVRFDDGVFEAIRFANVFAGIDIDGHQRLGLIDHDVAAGFQPNLRPQSLLQ